MSLYKLFPKDEDLIQKIFIRDYFCAIKCSLPKDYNDPYELFLGLDTSVSTRDLAFYNDVIQEIPQLPTTCFSRLIVSLPMWAHYGSNNMGYAIEYDDKILKERFPDASIQNMNYVSEPSKNIAKTLQMASGTLKPRYLQFLRQTVMYNAYFSKLEEWSYEKECRFVGTGNYTEKVDSNDILFIPISAVKSIILGKNISQTNKDRLIEISKKYKIKVYNFNISKTSSSPFLTDLDGESFVFDKEKEEIISAHKTCKNCPQPLFTESEICEICSITESHKQDAIDRNTFRLLHHAGILDQYLKEFNSISSNK